MIRRGALIVAAALMVGSCGGGRSGADIPYANAPGTAFAPRFSPTPSPRGVPPIPTPGRFFPAVTAADAGPEGPVCGDPRLIGREIAPIRGSNPGCGVAAPVRVTSVAGVRLTAAVRVNCATARALAGWTERTAKPAARRHLGATLASMRPVASYACRTRNSQRGALISEHGRGNAVDLASFTAANGRTAAVLGDWRSDDGGGPFLREIWRGACGPFGTVLGPDSDRFHQDHLHFDIARHRNGSYCR